MPLWSPDSSSIVATAGDTIADNSADILVFQADGQGESDLLGQRRRQRQLLGDLVADGRWVAWDHQAWGHGVRPAFAAPDGTALNILDEPYLNGWEPVWSPDGTRVVVHIGPEQATSESWRSYPRGNDLGIIDPTGQADDGRPSP